MMSLDVTIPERCHIIINGIDYAGWDVHHMFHHLDGTGEFVVDYKINGSIVQQKTIPMNKQQNIDVMIAMAEDRIIYLKKEIEKEEARIADLSNLEPHIFLISETRNRWKIDEVANFGQYTLDVVELTEVDGNITDTFFIVYVKSTSWLSAFTKGISLICDRILEMETEK